MKIVPIAMLGIFVCAVVTSCCTTAPRTTVLYQAQCMIETENSDVFVEVMLDNKFIFSGKTHQEKSGNLESCQFTAAPGEHLLVVSAAGHQTWEKQITLVGGSNKFWIPLKTK